MSKNAKKVKSSDETSTRNDTSFDQHKGISPEHEFTAGRNELYFPENAVIDEPMYIKRYGERLEELRKEGVGDGELSLQDLSDACKVKITKQAIKAIIDGKRKKINIKVCNELAGFFQCSSYYLVGYTEDKNGIYVNGECLKLPFVVGETQEFFDVNKANYWCRVDPELFSVLDGVFHLRPENRKIIREALKLMSKK